MSLLWHRYDTITLNTSIIPLQCKQTCYVIHSSVYILYKIFSILTCYHMRSCEHLLSPNRPKFHYLLCCVEGVKMRHIGLVGCCGQLKLCSLLWGRKEAEFGRKFFFNIFIVYYSRKNASFNLKKTMRNRLHIKLVRVHLPPLVKLYINV